MANNGLFNFGSGIQFQPNVQARYEAWANDPKNAPAIQKALQRPGQSLMTRQPKLQAALDAGVLTPDDFKNAASNDSNISIDANGMVGPHEGLLKGAGPAILGGIGVAAAPTILGATGATGAGGASSASAAGSTGAASAAGGTGILGKIGAASTILGGAAGANAKESAINDQNKLSKGKLQLDRDKFAISAPTDRLKAGILSALTKTATPAAVKWGGPGSGLRGEVPTYSGGIKSLYPAMQDPSVQSLSNSALEDELHQQLTNTDSSLGDAGNVGEESVGSKLLGAGALGTSLLSLLAKRKQTGGAPPVPGVPSYLSGVSDDPTQMGG